MQYAKFSELLGFQHRKLSTNHLNFAPNSVLPNEQAHLEIITPWFNTGEKRLSLPRPIVLQHSSYAKRYLRHSLDLFPTEIRKRSTKLTLTGLCWTIVSFLCNFNGSW